MFCFVSFLVYTILFLYCAWKAIYYLSYFLLSGPSACLYCSFFEAIYWVDCCFWPWRWECKSGVYSTNYSIQHFIPFALLRECLILNYILHTDTRSTCCCMGDFTGKDINGQLLFHFSSCLHAYEKPQVCSSIGSSI